MGFIKMEANKIQDILKTLVGEEGDNRKTNVK